MASNSRRAGPSRVATALVALLIFGLPANPAAHDIPNDVLVQAFLKPEGERLRLLVRAPLSGMLDMDFPVRGLGYLDLAVADPALREAARVWLAGDIHLFENDRRLPDPAIAAIRVSLPSDRSFASYDRALAHVLTGARLPDDTQLFWNQGMLDVLFEYPIESDRSAFSIRAELERLGLRVTTALLFVPDGSVRAFEFHGNPGLFRLDPRWHQAALHFVKLGFFHILDGIDHLLFLLCLIIPFRRFRTLVLVVTSFTVAHSVTLIASAFELAPDALWFPPLVETLIAMSIVYMALENIVAANLRRRWLITFGFGLVHGFGFSFALRETLQFAGSHLLTSLLSFNVGVELGQILVLTLLVPLVAVLFRFVVAERMGTIILSALVAHTGWHWMTERASQLLQFPLGWPALDAALLASAMRWLMALVVVAALLWLIFGVFRHSAHRRAEDEAAVGADE